MDALLRSVSTAGLFGMQNAANVQAMRACRPLIVRRVLDGMLDALAGFAGNAKC